MPSKLYEPKNQKKIVIALSILSILFVFTIIALVIIDVNSPPQAKQFTGNVTVVICEKTSGTRAAAQIKATQKFMPFVKAILVISSVNDSGITLGPIPVVVVHQAFERPSEAFLLIPALISESPLLTTDIFWLGNSVIPRKGLSPSDLVVITHRYTRIKFFNGLAITPTLIREAEPIDGDAVPSAILNVSKFTDSVKGMLLNLVSSQSTIFSPQMSQQLLFINGDQKYNDNLMSDAQKITKELFVCVSAVDSVAEEFVTFTDDLFTQISDQ